MFSVLKQFIMYVDAVLTLAQILSLKNEDNAFILCFLFAWKRKAGVMCKLFHTYSTPVASNPVGSCSVLCVGVSLDRC